MESEGSLPHSQQPATCSYPKPDQSSPCFPFPNTVASAVTPCCRVTNEKLGGRQLAKKCPTLYGTRRFITTFTTAYYLFLYSDQSSPCLDSAVNLCCRVLHEKLGGPQLVNKRPTVYGTRRFITTYTTARHLFLSWAKSVQSMPPLP
jgi:hypothetical protein